MNFVTGTCEFVVLLRETQQFEDVLDVKDKERFIGELEIKTVSKVRRTVLFGDHFKRSKKFSNCYRIVRWRMPFSFKNRIYISAIRVKNISRAV